MRLSEAMMLGSATCKMVPGDWNSCSLGAAANAVGIPRAEGMFGIQRINAILKEWPWINSPRF